MNDLKFTESHVLFGTCWYLCCHMGVLWSLEASELPQIIGRYQSVGHFTIQFNTHGIHGAGICANMTGVYWWDPWHTIYTSTMDPSWDMDQSTPGILQAPGMALRWYLHLVIFGFWLMESTLWLFNIAIENGPFIDGLLIINGDFPWLC